jgi:hypothetical protein
VPGSAPAAEQGHLTQLRKVQPQGTRACLKIMKTRRDAKLVVLTSPASCGSLSIANTIVKNTVLEVIDRKVHAGEKQHKRPSLLT